MTKSHPIVLFTYNRPWHTAQVLDALSRNELAVESDLIIFVDGPKPNASSKQIEKIEKVRETVRKQTWCKSLTLHISEYNIGCRNSIINGLSSVFELYDAVIVLEDDIVTSPFFLRYMNDALNFYANRQSVFSISAYNIPNHILPIPSDYNYDVYVSYRQQNWGWGTWSNRWKQVSWDKDLIPRFLLNTNQVEAFNRGGEDLSKMLREEYDGQSDAWDIQFSYAHFANHAISITPCHSYTKNIGLDDSGTHTINKSSSSYTIDLDLCAKQPRFLDVLYDDKRIINAYYSSFYPKRRALWKKAVNKLCRLMGYSNLFVVKKKIYI